MHGSEDAYQVFSGSEDAYQVPKITAEIQCHFLFVVFADRFVGKALGSSFNNFFHDLKMMHAKFGVDWT